MALNQYYIESVDVFNFKGDDNQGDPNNMKKHYNYPYQSTRCFEAYCAPDAANMIKDWVNGRSGLYFRKKFGLPNGRIIIIHLKRRIRDEKGAVVARPYVGAFGFGVH